MLFLLGVAESILFLLCAPTKVVTLLAVKPSARVLDITLQNH